MSSNIEIKRTCEFCGKEFTAKTLVTKYCSHTCNSRHYKQLKREEKVAKVIQSTPQKAKQPEPQIIPSDINEKQFLSIKEAYTLLGISERTFYRLMKTNTISATKLGGRTIIKRTDIDKLFTL